MESGNGDVLQAGDLVVLPSDYTATARGKVLTLSVREFELLVALMRSQGRIASREDLYRRVWSSELKPNDRSVDVYVHKLRLKLSAAMPDWRYIHTHFAIGYRFHAERSQVGNNLATTP